MLEFADEVVEFKLKGKKYQVSKPNNGQIKSYTHKLKGCKTDESKEKALKDFLKELGLQVTAYDLLSPNQMTVLIEKLYEAEKN